MRLSFWSIFLLVLILVVLAYAASLLVPEETLFVHLGGLGIFLFLVFFGLVTAFCTVVVARFSWHAWLKRARRLIRGQASTPSVQRDPAQISWSARSLKIILQGELRGDEILVVSNREPYLHVRRKDNIEVQRPASGLVTALEPIMRACSGTWIAHGSGDADREVVDQNDRVRVPPDSPSYQIRRVWLTPEEEKGFYLGFANEGLWPLCHIAHHRPIFRVDDWDWYKLVNEKFAKVVIEEAKTDDPVILVQDYHFALLPRLIKTEMPRATVITFWHIPWPNPESFGICPWRKEILDGLLGSDILGFHTRLHCNNFIASVDRFLESRIDHDLSTITVGGKLTAVNAYPISVEYPSRWSDRLLPVAECRRIVQERLGLNPSIKIGIGVDRLDYTKGIPERFRAVERLFELHPEWIGRFCFVQIASPSRVAIGRYQSFGDEVKELADHINRRFSKPGFQPIHLLVEHHQPWQVYEYFRAADLCVVSSLHDGMNLVAKEFVVARDDEQGILVLSQFTGAARELPEALIVNPYDTEQCAAALHFALEMDPVEQQARMRNMRLYVEEFNIYRWAGKMLIDAARLRREQRLFHRISSLPI